MENQDVYRDLLCSGDKILCDNYRILVVDQILDDYVYGYEINEPVYFKIHRKYIRYGYHSERYCRIHDTSVPSYYCSHINTAFIEKSRRYEFKGQ